jgi:hypothetical protein
MTPPPPVSLRFDANSYCSLYLLIRTAISVNGPLETKQRVDMIDVLADMKLRPPHSLFFPRRGKLLKVSRSQAMAMRQLLSNWASQYPATPDLLTLLSLLDKALIDYQPGTGHW